ncbi:hypothetical protein [Polaribacter sp. OB-PA-B3]
MFLLVLMFPASIQITHALENHDHVVCSSKVEQHIHQDSLNCDELHKQLIIFNFTFNSFELAETEIYKTDFLSKNIRLKEVTVSKKSSRAPPEFTI